MAFPTGWGRKCALVIQASKIDSNQVNFPVLLDKTTLPSEMFDADGSYPALNGGGDIRFSSDSAGNTRLSCEIVTFITDNDPANGVTEIWVKVPSVSASSNTTIYIWYHKSGESQPAIDAAYGAESVWNSNFKMVQHMNEDPSGSSPQILDSTSNDNNCTSAGTMLTEDLVAAKIDKGLDLDGTDDYVLRSAGIGISETDSKSVFAWIYPHEGSDTYPRIVNHMPDANSRWALTIDFYNENAGYFSVGGTPNENGIYGITTSTFPSNQQHCIGWTFDGSTWTVYVNGQSYATDTQGGTLGFDGTTGLLLGARTSDTGYYFNGLIDEVHISNIARSANWIKAEYNNQNDPSTFVVEGTPETPNGITTICHLMIMGM